MSDDLKMFRVTLLHKHLGTKHECKVMAPTIHRAYPAAQKVIEDQIKSGQLPNMHVLDFVLLGQVEVPNEV